MTKLIAATVWERNYAFRLICGLAGMLMAAAVVHLAHQHSRNQLALSGDEYYFYYAATGRFVDNPTDPIWAMQARIGEARAELESMAKGNAKCARDTEAARGTLEELRSLLWNESSGQGYGFSTQMQGLSVRFWNAKLMNYGKSGDSDYALELGRRMAFGIAFPLVLIIAVCFAIGAATRSIAIFSLFGLYVLLHSFVRPAAEAYWSSAHQALENPLWILSATVIPPFVNPRYSDALVALAPRAYLIIPFLLALAFRWSGFTRASYGIVATLALFHSTGGAMVLGMLVAIDLLFRPQVFKDWVVTGLVVVGVALALVNGAGAIFNRLAGVHWSMLVAITVVMAGAALMYAMLMSRWRWFQAASSWATKNVVLLDLFVFGPAFFAVWAVLALVHANFGVPTAYGLVNLATKSGATAHYAFFFGLFWIVGSWLIAAIGRLAGPVLTFSVILLVISMGSALAFVAGPRVPDNPDLIRKYGVISQSHDAVARTRPVNLENFETHYMWHRIVRQRETGGDWIANAFDLSPYRASCSR